MDPLAFEQRQLSSGALAVWQDRPEVDYLMIGALVRVGSICDPPGKEGLAHLFEHLPFEGTTDYPNNLKLSRAVESEGGSLNAGTGINMTFFHILMPVWQSETAWHVLEEMLFRPLLTRENFYGQLRDIINEMAANANEFPPQRNIDRAYRAFFGPTMGRKSRVIGWPSSLMRISLKDLGAFHRRYYRPSNMIFLATGNLSKFPQPWPEFLDRQLIGWPAELPSAWPTCELSPVSNPIWWETKRHDDIKPRVAVGVRITHTADETQAESHRIHHVSGLINHLLSCGESSLLFQRIREHDTLVYDGDSDISFLTRNAVVWSFCGTTNDWAGTHLLLGALGSVLGQPESITDDDVAIAKSGIIGQWALEDITPKTAFLWALRFLPEGSRIPTRTEWQGQFSSVTPEDVRQLIAQDFNPSRWLTILYRPVST